MRCLDLGVGALLPSGHLPSGPAGNEQRADRTRQSKGACSVGLPRRQGTDSGRRHRRAGARELEHSPAVALARARNHAGVVADGAGAVACGAVTQSAKFFLFALQASSAGRTSCRPGVRSTRSVVPGEGATRGQLLIAHADAIPGPDDTVVDVVGHRLATLRASRLVRRTATLTLVGRRRSRGPRLTASRGGVRTPKREKHGNGPALGGGSSTWQAHGSLVERRQGIRDL